MNLGCFSVSSLMKPLLRALSYFRPDAGRIWVVLVLLLVSVGLNVLKPWPLALLVDNVLGKKTYPAWVPEIVKNWNALTQITAIALAFPRRFNIVRLTGSCGGDRCQVCV